MPEPVKPPDRTLHRVRRAPNFAHFIIVGAFVGIALGLFFGQRGSSGNYSDGSAMGLLAILFGGLGALLAAIVALVVDRWSRRDR